LKVTAHPATGTYTSEIWFGDNTDEDVGVMSFESVSGNWLLTSAKSSGGLTVAAHGASHLKVWDLDTQEQLGLYPSAIYFYAEEAAHPAHTVCLLETTPPRGTKDLRLWFGGEANATYHWTPTLFSTLGGISAATSIDGPLGSVTPNTGAFTTVTASTPITAANINWTAPGTIGSVTPNTIKGTTGTFTSDVVVLGGDITAGTGGTTRGAIHVARGAGGNTPGYFSGDSANGTTGYAYFDASGILHSGPTIPTADGTDLYQMINPASPPILGATTPNTATFSLLEVNGRFRTTSILAFTADTPTPAVYGGNIFKVPATWTAGHNITMFTDGVTGQRIVILGGDADCVVVDGGDLLMTGNWTAAVNATLELIFDGADWVELGRSANG